MSDFIDSDVVAMSPVFEQNGDIDFRYNLSRISEDAVTNVTVGLLNSGLERV